MRLRSQVIFSLIFSCFVVAGILSMGSTATFAEGSTVCNGRIIGSTKLSNVNAGQTHFDSHQGPGFEDNRVVSLAIVGLGEGLAPVSRDQAACADETTAKATPFKDKMYNIKGFAWNDNLGFVSLFCGADTKNQGVGCGANQYGVKIGKADGAGTRKLSGYAWNPSFGYMQFSGAGAIPWDVTMNATGDVKGYAWTEAGVWVNFEGIKIKLAGQVVDAITTDCSSRPFVCIEVKPDTGVVVADGVKGYEIHLYLFDEDGVTPMDLTKYDLSAMKFNWADTLKANQLVDQKWSPSNSAAVNKPATVTLGDFTKVADGHYKYKNLVASVAPTSSANISYTTASKPSISIKNEQFLGPIPSGIIEPSELIMKYFEFILKTKSDGKQVMFEGVPVDKAYPNNKDGFALNFKPAIELDTLYANNQQDAIAMIRGIPVNIRTRVKINTQVSFNSAEIGMYLGYDVNAQEQSQGCGDKQALQGFDIRFTRDLAGENLTGINDVNIASGITPSLLEGVDLQAVATLPDVKEGDEVSPCTNVEGPTVYSVVNYVAGEKAVKYYSNKLPRTVTDIANPAAVAHGNVYAQKAFSPSSGVAAVQEIRTKGVNTLRDGLYETITTRLGVKVTAATKDPTRTCTIIGLSGKDAHNVICENVNDYKQYLIDGEERVLYFSNTNVILDMATYKGRNAVIVENGSIFINKNIYKSSKSINDKVVLVGLRPYSFGCGKGNVYIRNDVTNIQASIFSDCSIYSYYDGQTIGVNGRPVWSDFTAMVEKLGKQLFIEGSIAAAVTYGGGDSDELGYLRSPFEVIPLEKADANKRMEIQQSDVNYLRLFKLSLEMSDGLPIDQSCGKALNFDDILAIQKYNEDPIDNSPVIGETVDESFGEPSVCDGIDSLNAFNPEDIGAGGDLVPPTDKSLLAKGLAAKAYDPVYIFYVPPRSFIFEK